MPDADRDATRQYDVMSVTQAAVFLRVSPDDLVSAAESGQVPFRSRGGDLWFSRFELVAVMSGAHVARGGPDAGW